MVATLSLSSSPRYERTKNPLSNSPPSFLLQQATAEGAEEGISCRSLPGGGGGGGNEQFPHSFFREKLGKGGKKIPYWWSLEAIFGRHQLGAKRETRRLVSNPPPFFLRRLLPFSSSLFFREIAVCENEANVSSYLQEKRKRGNEMDANNDSRSFRSTWCCTLLLLPGKCNSPRFGKLGSGKGRVVVA